MSNPNPNRPLYTLCQYSGGIRTDHTSTSNPIYSTAGMLYELYSTARVQAMRQRLMTNTSSRFVPEFKLKPQAQTQLPCYATSPQNFFSCRKHESERYMRHVYELYIENSPILRMVEAIRETLFPLLLLLLRCEIPVRECYTIVALAIERWDGQRIL